MRISRSRLLLFSAIVAGGIVVIFLLRPSPIEVDSVQAVRGPIVVTVRDEGRTEVQERFAVTAPITGRVDRITFRAGDPVELGAPVATLHPAPLDPRTRAQNQAELEAALDSERIGEAEVLQVEASLDQARRDRERAEALYAQELVSLGFVEHLQLDELVRERELESARLRRDAARHRVEGARAALLAADDRSPQGTAVTVRSPVSGVVLSIPERSERVVSAGEPLLEIGDPLALEVVADFISTDAVRVEPGDRMMLGAWGGEEIVEGLVRVVEPSAFTKVSALGVEEQRVNIRGDLIDPAGRLRDGYRVEVSIVIDESDDVVKVPSSALFRIDDVWHLFVIERDRARLRIVTVGARSTRETEIVDGLSEDDLVIRHPTDELEDGVRVRART